MDLSLLLEDQANRMPEEYQVSSNGQFLVLEQNWGQRRRKQISYIFSWMKPFSRYVAALTSYESTTSAQATGLVAHLHLILQLSQELGPQWLKYDTEFRQWAAARNVRQWGDLNFTIYGHCLSAQNRSPAVEKEIFLLTGHKRPASQGACYKWNSKGRCDRTACQFSHSFLWCGGRHQASFCPSAAKRNK